LDLYRLAVEMADRLSARRANANSFFLALQTALTAVLATVAGGSLIDRNDTVLAAAALAGAVTALAWWMLLRSYRDLNRAKYAVINRIEEEHLSLRLFTDEWAELQRRVERPRRWKGRYAELGDAERVVPIVFLSLYLGLTAYLLLR
jgi:hypothetical protein